MIDVHNHILWGIDDGPDLLEESLEMARLNAILGITQIIATPHYVPDTYETVYEKVKQQVKKLNRCLIDNKIPIQVYPGQEVRLTPDIAEHFYEKKIGTLNGKSYMLIELPPRKLEKVDYTAIDELTYLGIKPIIAHIERYTLKKDYRGVLSELKKHKCYFQMNSDNLMGLNGYRMKKWCQELIKSNEIFALASDAHSAVGRNSGLREGYDVVKSKEIILVLKKNVEHILKGEDVVLISST